MLLVGLTGGIGSGKSLVAQMFKQLGAYLIDADELAHKAVEPGHPVLNRIVEAFGPEILNPDRTLNRATLGRLVFDHPEKRELLNSIVHPYVFMEEERQQREIAQKDPKAIVLFDAALLIETGSYQLMDKVILVTIDRRKQISRIMRRDGLSREEAVKRIGAQMPQAKKKSKADYIIDGGQSPKAVEEQVRRIYEELKPLA
ncbi:MAG TPA: dephospho-CoA kinase [Nitrospiria bacterium]|jgi:dephospho-CoA kinase|nr:dephospho-CoA kinase [Nitrospiria bacterium]